MGWTAFEQGVPRDKSPGDMCGDYAGEELADWLAGWDARSAHEAKGKI
jgi:hypothetical protein